MRVHPGVLAGAVLVVLGPLLAMRSFPLLGKEMTPRAPVDQPVPSVQAQTVAIALKPGEMLVVRDDRGAAVIELTDHRVRAVAYRWRARSATTGKEEFGTGTLVEQMEPPRADGSTWLDRERSQTRIVAGPFSLQWSYMSLEGGWLYPQAVTKPLVMNADAFATLSLAK